MARHPLHAARLLLGVGVLALLTPGCGDAEATEEGAQAAVATVGGAAIGAEDFARSFELGFPHLKRGDDPRRAYLEHMVAEKVLALEGYRLGLDTARAVRDQVADLLDELLVEQVFEREVNARVQVTEQEVTEALQREAVRFRLRYVPAATLAEAEAVRQGISQDGFDAALARQLARRSDVPLRPEDFVTPLLSPAEVPAPLLEAVRELPPGVPSAPVAMGGQYVVVEVVDVQREPVPMGADARDHVRQTLFQEKARAQARAYVTARMEPVGLRVKGGVFRDLSRTLWAWYQTLEGPPLRLADALAEADGPEAAAVRAQREAVLATTRDSTITVGELLAAFPARRYALSTESEAAFQSDLFDAIGLALRDAAFVREARAAGLHQAPEVTAALARWTDKWVYQAVVQHIADTTRVTDADVAGYRARHAAHYDALGLTPSALDARVRADTRRAKARAALPRVVAALRQRHPVTVHDDVLEAAVPASEATAGLPVLLFKAHTGRPLYPVADPAW